MFTHLSEPGAKADSPTLVMLHGTGGDEVEMLRLGQTLRPTANLLSARGKEPEHGQNRWFRRLAEGVFDEPNLIERANEFSDWLLAERPNDHRVAVGFSNGANFAAAILLLRPEVFHSAVLLAPMVPLTPASLPNLEAKPILMVCGEVDPIVPRMNAMTLAGMFETAGADLQVHWHPGGHGLDAVSVRVVQAWLPAHGA